MIEDKPYLLHIDGPTFRAQRTLLLAICSLASSRQAYEPAPGHVHLLEGLVTLTDSIADQAFDKHGIDCLLS